MTKVPMYCYNASCSGVTLVDWPNPYDLNYTQWVCAHCGYTNAHSTMYGYAGCWRGQNTQPSQIASSPDFSSVEVRVPHTLSTDQPPRKTNWASVIEISVAVAVVSAILGTLLYWVVAALLGRIG